jgi:hypothetical protein
MLPDLANLILHHMVVVAQPVFGADGERIPPAGARKERIGLVEPIGALIKPREERPSPPRITCEAVRRRNPRRVGLELVRSEKLCCWRPDAHVTLL